MGKSKLSGKAKGKNRYGAGVRVGSFGIEFWLGEDFMVGVRVSGWGRS